MLRNIIYLGISIIIFFAGVITYGIILNIREVTLQEALENIGMSELKNSSIVIDKKKYALSLYSDSIVVKSYKAVFGKNLSSSRNSIYDNSTPEGKYSICRIDSSSRYHLFLQLDYPSRNDLAKALKSGAISEGEYVEFIAKLDEYGCMPEESSNLKNVGIHGIGEYDFVFRNLPFAFNWTNGSVAVSNDSIEEICSVVKIGTPVTIKYGN